MRNFVSKIPLGNNKFAYEQAPAFRESGIHHKRLLESKWSAPDFFYHANKGGHVAALRAHLNNNLFSKVDLSRFYYRITKNKIIRSLKKIGISYEDGTELAAEAVVKTDTGFSLPYGFVQSPILSSIVMDKSALGAFLGSIPREIVATVYVDDILLSTNGNEHLLRETTESLVDIAEYSGFPVNEDKSELVEPLVTSFNVELSNQSLVLTDERMDQFRDFLRHEPNDAQVTGVLEYVRQINAPQFDHLRRYAATR